MNYHPIANIEWFGRISKIAALLLCSYLTLGPLLIPAQTQPKMPSKYDGKWWLSITPNEQDGFATGYFDCYVYEYKGPDKYTERSFDEYERLVTVYYKNNLSKGSLPISEAIHELRDRPGEVASRGGEISREPHAYFDGLYWKQTSALGGKESHLGFVEGYLFCHAELAHNRGGIFSKSPAELSGLITKWYGLKEDTGDIDEKREPAKIADVLFRLRDHASNR